MHVQELINKINHRESLNEEELHWIVNTCGIYTEKGHNDKDYYYMSTLCKLDNIYIVINWDKRIAKNRKNKYYQPFLVTKIETKYLHHIFLDDGTSYVLTFDKSIV